jgi:hypothetical protein
MTNGLLELARRDERRVRRPGHRQQVRRETESADLAGGPRQRPHTDWAMPWMLADCGVLRYWISVSDLRAQRFDGVRVTVEGH